MLVQVQQFPLSLCEVGPSLQSCHISTALPVDWKLQQFLLSVHPVLQVGLLVVVRGQQHIQNHVLQALRSERERQVTQEKAHANMSPDGHRPHPRCPPTHLCPWWNHFKCGSTTDTNGRAGGRHGCGHGWCPDTCTLKFSRWAILMYFTS